MMKVGIEQLQKTTLEGIQAKLIECVYCLALHAQALPHAELYRGAMDIADSVMTTDK